MTAMPAILAQVRPGRMTHASQLEAMACVEETRDNHAGSRSESRPEVQQPSSWDRMPAQPDDAANRSFAGRFSVTEERGVLVLARSRENLQLIFSQVASHDLPARLDGVCLATVRPMPGDASRSCFELRSGASSCTVAARSLQIHEQAALYGNVIPLPRFGVRQRLLWSLLLRAARFRCGQALIRRVTGRDSPAAAARIAGP